MRELRATVAVVGTDTAFVTALAADLNRCAAQEERSPQHCEFEFVLAPDLNAARQLAVADGLLQAVVLDAGSLRAPEEAVRELARLRPELDLFLMVAGTTDVQDLPVELLDRRDDKPVHLYRQVRNAIARRARTPFADTLRDYVYSAKDAWHTPGHSGGDSLRDSPWVSDFYQMMGEHIFNTDLSVSVQSLDSLLEPHSVIQEAQELAAQAFGARHTFFVTNGTSTANKVILQQMLGAGGKVILDQACHKSVHHAMVLFGAEPVYLEASLNPRYGFYGPVPRERVLAAIAAHPDARLLVLTNCTYDGFRYDLGPIIECAHAAGIKVLIDEAWYAHGRFHPQTRPCALECGADYVTQSTHKMLSAFSQASMIHVGDPDFDEHRFRENLNMHTSTSPQYAMIASLDVARKQMSMEGFGRLQHCFAIAERLREGIDHTGVFRVLTLADMLPQELGDDGIRLDPCKLSVDVSASGFSARQLQLMLFEDFGIQVEKVTHNTLSILVTLGATDSKVLRLLNALHKLAARSSAGRSTVPVRRSVTPLPTLSEFLLLPRQAYFGPTRALPLVADGRGVNPGLVGAVSADQIVPYPPGIPVLIPGQVVTAEIADFLFDLHHSNSGIEIHGLVGEGEDACLRVVRDAPQVSRAAAAAKSAGS
jgi:arginine decarboxylase